jgi:hypothetical protein
VEALLQDKCGTLWKRFQGDTTGLTRASESEIDQSVITILLQKGIDETEIIHAIRYRRAAAGAKEKSDDYFERSVKEAKNWIAGEKKLALDGAAKQKKKRKPKLKIVPDPSSGSDTPVDDATDADAPLEDLTDAGLAAAFIRYHGENLLYCDGVWFFYDGTRFGRDDTGELCRLWLEISDLLLHEAADELDSGRQAYQYGETLPVGPRPARCLDNCRLQSRGRGSYGSA